MTMTTLFILLAVFYISIFGISYYVKQQRKQAVAKHADAVRFHLLIMRLGKNGVEKFDKMRVESIRYEVSDIGEIEGISKNDLRLMKKYGYGYRIMDNPTMEDELLYDLIYKEK